MVKMTIHGGTHLGIVGLYGEKVFELDSPHDLEQAIREDRNLPLANKSCYTSSDGHPIHTLTDEEGKTIFEYRIVELEF
jgi:hypothetical protein